MTIWKYPIYARKSFSLVMPKDAEILSIQVQHGEPVLWALVDPSKTNWTYEFRVFATGEEIGGHPGRHRGTFQLQGGGLVFHIFD